MLEGTGERYLPWLEDPYSGYEHLHRYAYATQFVGNKRVLDLACGEGYGSRLLARSAQSVVGVDIDEDAIRHASNKYVKGNLLFKKASITDLAVEGQNMFDVIVCFKAIEHTDDFEKLLKEVKTILTPDGIFIVSTPNKTAYSDEPKHENPCHVYELYLDEFTKLFGTYFKQVIIFGQRIYCNSNIWPIPTHGNSVLAEYLIERNPKEFSFVEGDKRVPLHFIALASDAEKAISGIASSLVDISNELLKQKDAAMGNLVAARDHLEATVRTQQQALNELTQAVAERDRLNEEIKQFRSTVQSQQRALDAKGRELVQLAAERESLRERLQFSTRVHEQELESIKNTIGWKVLNKYRETRQKSAVLRRLHFLFTEPVKRVFRKGIDIRTPPSDLPPDARLQCPSTSARSVLVLGHWLPAADRSAGGLRAFNILEILREEGCSVAFGADREKLEHVWLFGSEQEVNQYEKMLERLNIEVLYGSKAVLRHLYEKGYEYRFVVLSFPEVAYRYLSYVRAYAINAKVVYDPVDLHWLRMKRESGIKDDDVLRQQSENFRRMERFNAAGADIVFAVTQEEKSQILEEVKDAKVEVIPTIHACVDKVKPLAGRKNLLFVGHYAHSPNEDAVCYFVKEILPLIRQDIPGVVFYMVGSHITETVRSLASRDVVAVGYAPDLTPYLDGCRVFVAPLRYGAGIKGKIGHSMGFGLPVVTTSIGAEGMNLIDGEHVLIANTPAAFASAVVRLYTDNPLWEKMSQNALLHIKSKFSKAVVQTNLAQIFAPEFDGVSSSIAEVG
jgi:SAM-dependent methyltransferase/glycosyltransferase involved in cell wall biosynthesis